MFESLLIGLSPRLSAWIVGVLPEFSTALTTAGLVRGIPYLAIGPRDGTTPVRPLLSVQGSILHLFGRPRGPEGDSSRLCERLRPSQPVCSATWKPCSRLCALVLLMLCRIVRRMLATPHSMVRQLRPRQSHSFLVLLATSRACFRLGGPADCSSQLRYRISVAHIRVKCSLDRSFTHRNSNAIHHRSRNLSFCRYYTTPW